MTAWTLAASVLVAGAAYLVLTGYLSTWRKYRGVRLITCPENARPAAVSVNALRAAHWRAVAGEPVVNLKSCSRWPEMQGCDEACLSQIEASPQSCLVRTIVADWYTGKACVFCHKPIGRIVWHERPPAIRVSDGAIHEWTGVRVEDLPDLFRSADPVCWSCYVVEGFRHDHDDFVVERHRIEETMHTIAPSSAVY
ncbi:MAG TPA: hypothetical protein VGR95_09430 [Thermoanaerobaculia bacterium]|jgi:hypothetical protein|nr:hypothetical protein [Thermoanaerobaculia bacterium]